MAKGLSLHIGVNVCDPEHYNGWSGPLNGCESDANTMHALATAAGFEPQMLKTADATRGAVSTAISDAARSLQPGDIFLVTYAGHGGQISDVDGDEEDQIDETWCLYDGQLLDDELSILWAQFSAGVRVLILSDSCHSGTVAKGQAFRRNAMGRRNSLFAEVKEEDDGVPRFMPRSAARETQRKNKAFYAGIQNNLPSPRPEIVASIRLISGCQEDQYSYEKNGAGMFTTMLKQTWSDGDFDGDYDAFHKAIRGQMKPKQQPNHLKLGAASAEYDSQRPFTIV